MMIFLIHFGDVRLYGNTDERILIIKTDII